MRDEISSSCGCDPYCGPKQGHSVWGLSGSCPAPTPQVRQAGSMLEASTKPPTACPVSCSDTIWLHIRSEGQWTNRLYESFKTSCPMDCDPKPLSRSLKMRRSQRRPEVGRFGGGRVHHGEKPNRDYVAVFSAGEHPSLSNCCIH